VFVFGSSSSVFISDTKTGGMKGLLRHALEGIRDIASIGSS
jgi:hypothetical protein